MCLSLPEVCSKHLCAVIFINDLSPKFAPTELVGPLTRGGLNLIGLMRRTETLDPSIRAELVIWLVKDTLSSWKLQHSARLKFPAYD